MDSEFDIAIVGMACRFPGAANLEAFWRNLIEGVESIRPLSDEEILASGVTPTQLKDPAYVKAAPILDEPEWFDPEFFGFSLREAKWMDPQHRILLELAHEALEDAGCEPNKVLGRVGVFAGSAMNTYFTATGLSRRLADEYIPILIANDKDFLSTRISYKLNLKGPSLTVQTACSTSAVAVHLARQSLLSGETDLALAGAISVRIPQKTGYLFEEGGVLSADGHVRAFDAKASGTVFGSGGGFIVLKRLSEAVAGGDSIYAVIKGSAMNNDGADKAGYSAPSVNGQAEVVVEALANAGIEAETLSYLEAHGSGTSVGDPIEVRALTEGFRASTERTGFCAIGSVKTNVGHLDAAAAIAGIIKTALALQHRQLPASLHFSEPNPEIDFPSTPFYVNARRVDWEASGPRRAGVMSTGMGGTNACIILEEAPAFEPVSQDDEPNLLVLSARTEDSLRSTSGRLLDFLIRNPELPLRDVAYTLQTGRRAFEFRQTLVCSNTQNAIDVLGKEGSSGTWKRRVVDSGGTRRPIVFLLPGIGDHYLGMAHGLYETGGVFQVEFDRCARLLQPHLGLDIREIVFPRNHCWKKASASKGIDLKRMLGRRTEELSGPESAELNRTRFAQPILFSVEYAMAKLWEHFGVTADAFVGHSMGEYVAACFAGVMSLEVALRLIARRAQLVDDLPKGSMLAVSLPEKEVVPLLTPALSVALINGPNLCVVAGPPEDVDALELRLAKEKVISRRVRNTHAFHSKLLNPILAPFEAEVRAVELREPTKPFISNVTGRWILGREATEPAYWARHATQTARFNDALHHLWKMENPVLVEVGPGRTLGVLATQHPDRPQSDEIVAISSLRHDYENVPDKEYLLRNVGRAWLSGIDLDWEHLESRGQRRKVHLPAYPFARQRCWFEEEPCQSQPQPENKGKLEKRGIDDWFYSVSWERSVGPIDRTGARAEKACQWLIFADRWGGSWPVFKEKLEREGARVGVVQFGTCFSNLGSGHFEVDPSQADDFVKLFRLLMPTCGDDINILHFGGLAPEETMREKEPGFATQNFGFFSLLYIAKAIAEVSFSGLVRMAVVTSRLHEVAGGEKLNPEMAAVLGPVGAIPKELPNVSCINIDLADISAIDEKQGELAERILREFRAFKGHEVIAYRGKYRWRRTFEPLRFRLPASSESGPIGPRSRRIRDRGVYLITGGTGGIGLAVARYLAKEHQARLVLTKRSEFPDRSEWPRILAENAATEATRRVVKQLEEIRELGGEVEVFQADVADPKQMRKIIDRTIETCGAINGVVHGAGVFHAGLIQTKARGDSERVLTPKLLGSWALFDRLKDLDLDFFVLFSSLTSIAPYLDADHSGANAFLDAFAHYANSVARFPTIAINWPGWRETGQLLALKTQAGLEGWKANLLEKAILTADGLEAFRRALDCGLSQIIVSPEEIQQLLGHSVDEPSPISAADGMGDQKPMVPTVYAASSDREVPDVVAEIWRSVLGQKHVDRDASFSDLGGHSLLAIQIAARIRAAYQIEFTLKDVFDAPTVSRMGQLIEERILAEIEALSDDQARDLASRA